jgi:O-antigen ligase
VTLLARREGRPWFPPFLAFGVLGVALVGTLTRSSWFAFAAGAAVLAARTSLRWFTVAVLVVAGLVAFGRGELRDRLLQSFDPAYMTNAGRVSLWKSGAAVVRDHPWTGVGLADHYALIERYRRPDATFHAGHFHNNVVQVAAATGLVGLAAYLAWMGLLALGLVRAASRPGGGRAVVALAIWMAFQVHGLFDWSFGDVEVVDQFFLWSGLGLAALGIPEAAPDAAREAVSANRVRALSGAGPTP